MNSSGPASAARIIAVDTPSRVHLLRLGNHPRAVCHDTDVLESVVNISEGRDQGVLARLAAACGADLLDVHTDPDHNRSVFSLAGTAAPRQLTEEALRILDIGVHAGAHPRTGVVDVVPFVPLQGSTLADAIAARDAFARWAADELDLPCFMYGPERSLPTIRREAFSTLRPDSGPPAPHPTAGACAVGAREVLVAYNVWVTAPDLDAVRRVARQVRSPTVRALGLSVGKRFQVSCNLIAPDTVGPAEVTASVAAVGSAHDVEVDGCELVGLLPHRVLERIDPGTWTALDIGEERTIEARLTQRPRTHQK